MKMISSPLLDSFEKYTDKVEIKNTMILNVNDNALINLQKLGFGSFLRNYEGNFNFGFYGTLVG
jgi:hypothetical protein